MRRFWQRARGAFRRQAGASVTHYALLTALIAVAVLGAIQAVGGSVSCSFADLGSRIIGGGRAECAMAEAPPEEPQNPGEEQPEEPLDVTLDSLAFPDSAAQPGQYAVSRDVRVNGFSADLPVSISTQLPEAQAQVNVAGQGWADSAIIRNGQSIRLRMIAPAVFGESRVATVHIGDKSATWTVTVREQDTTPSTPFAFRPTPYSYADNEGNPVVLVPIADVNPSDSRRTEARFTIYGGGQVPPNYAAEQVAVSGFDGPLALRLESDLDGAVLFARRNNEAWVSGSDEAGVTALDVFPNDRIGVAMDVPPMAYNRDVTVTATLGTFSADWSVRTRPHDGTPEPVTFPDVTDLAPGDGSIYAYSETRNLVGLEIPSVFTLGSGAPAGAAVRACGSAACDAAPEASGWSGWGSSVTVCDGCAVQLRTAVPGGMDGVAEVALTGGNDSDPFYTLWTVSTVTDGPDRPSIAPATGANPYAMTGSSTITLRGTVKPVTVTVPSDALVQNGEDSGSAVTVRPGETFTVRAPAAGGFLGQADDRRSVPVQVTGLDSAGVERDWSAAWSPPAEFLIVNRAMVTVPTGFAIPTLFLQERSRPVASAEVPVSGFDGQLPITFTGPAGSSLTIGERTVALGQAGTIAAGEAFSVHLTTSAEWGGSVGATVTVGSGNDARSGVFTANTRPMRDTFDTLYFFGYEDLRAEQQVDSGILYLTGSDIPLQVSISGNPTARFRLGNPATWGEADWTTGPAMASSGQSLQIRQTTGRAYSASYTVTVVAGEDDAEWSVDTMSNTLQFDPQIDLDLSAPVQSERILLTGFVGPVALSVPADAEAEIWVDDVARGRSFTAANNRVVQLRSTAPASFATTRTVVLTANNRQAGWSLTTRGVMGGPGNVEFPPLEDVEPGTGRMTGAEIVLGGFDTQMTATAQGAMNPLVSVDGGPFAASGQVGPGSRVRLQFDRPREFQSSAQATLVVGTRAITQDVSSRSQNTCPEETEFPPLASAAPSTDALSDELRMTGIDGPLPVAVSATADAMLRVNRGAWAAAVSISEGDRLQIKVRMPETSNSNVDVLAVVGPSSSCQLSWKVNPQPPQVAFGDRRGLDPAAPFQIASIPGPISGLSGPLEVSVQGALGLVLKKNGGGGAASVTVENGDSLVLEGMAPAGFDTVATGLVRAGNVRTLLTVTTRSEKFGIPGLSLTANLAMEPGEENCHAPVALEDFDGQKVLSVFGHPTAVLKVDGSAGTSVSVREGQALEVCMTPGQVYSTPATVTVTYTPKPGGQPVFAPWVTATRAKRTAPLPLELETLYGAPANRPVSTSLIVTGFDETLQAHVKAAGPEGYNAQPTLQVNGGTPQTGEVAVKEGDQLTVSLTTPNAEDSWANAELTVGPTEAVWQVYTGIDNIPDEFDFDSGGTEYDISTPVLSNTVTLAGFEGQLLLTLTGDPSAYAIVNGTPSGNSVQVSAGDSVQLGTNSAASFGATLVTTVTVGAYATDTWEVRTRLLDNRPDPFPIEAVAGATPGMTVYSPDVTVTGFDQSQTLTMASNTLTGLEFSRDSGSTWSTGGTILAGEVLQFRARASSVAGANDSVTVTIGQTAEQWSVSTRAAGAPSVLPVEDLVWQELAMPAVMPAKTVANLVGAAPLRIVQRGPGQAQLRVGTGPWVTQATVNNGDQVQLRLTASSTRNTVRTAALTLGGQSFLWSVTSEGEPVQIVPPSATSYDRNEAISVAFTATGGYDTPVFALADSTVLPPGLSMSSAGAISGTPTTQGTYSFKVRAADSLARLPSNGATLSVSWTVAPSRPAVFSMATAGIYLAGDGSISLSNGNRTVDFIGDDAAHGSWTGSPDPNNPNAGDSWKWIHSDRGATAASGKVYFEITIDQFTTAVAEIGVVRANNSGEFVWDLNNFSGGYYYKRDGSAGSSDSNAETIARGTSPNLTVGVAIDMATNKIWFARIRNGTTFWLPGSNTTTSRGNPSNPSGTPAFFTVPGSGRLLIKVAGINGNNTSPYGGWRVTLNAGQEAFKGTVPTGFTGRMSEVN